MRGEAPTSRLRLGLGRVEITPPVGIYHRMWGAARHDRAAGVHRPLVADVLALAPLDRGPIHLRAHLDLVGLAQADHQNLREALAASAGIPAAQVVVAFSHTHSAGFFLPDRVALPGGELIPPYLLQLRQRLQEACLQAIYSMRACTITYASGACAMAANRDCWDAVSGQFVCGFNPEGEPDLTTLVARVSGPENEAVATLVNYACHPTSLAWETQLISPDYPGAMRETVEGATGAPCVFALGACGDQGPRDGFVGDPAVADRNGRQLAHAVLAVLEGMGPPATDFAYQGPVVSGATLGAWVHHPFGNERLEATTRFTGGTHSVDLPLKPGLDAPTFSAQLAEWTSRQQEAEARGDQLAARDCRARAERARRWLARLTDLPAGPTYGLRFSVHRLGDAVWIGCGAEPYSLVQTELRRRFPHRPILLSPLCSDLQVAYLLPRDRYGKGLYQEEPSSLGPGCLEQLIEAIAAQIAALEV
ncbi:MAG: hypothetical protein IT369_23480 [Candidatus Latescibacteria bacterium]|nr:hypothetical protein [Candidatus Latescibacterota bacterium]